MLNDCHIKFIRDYANSKDCFPGLSVSGGICYFLWDKEHSGLCDFTTINSGKENRAFRKLNEFPVFVRYNAAVDVIHKIKRMNEVSLVTLMSSRNPFGIPTNVRGQEVSFSGSYKVISSKGEGFIKENEILTNKKIADKYKVMVTRIMSEHAGEPDKNGQLNVLATIRVLYPKEVCTDSYIVGGVFDDVRFAKNMALYLKTKFVRFLLLQAAASINLSKATYAFVPLQDFSHPWTDAMLYEKYGLSQSEIDFIESMIRPME